MKACFPLLVSLLLLCYGCGTANESKTNLEVQPHVSANANSSETARSVPMTIPRTPENEIEMSVGIVSVAENEICLQTLNSELVPGSQISIVAWPRDIPQKIVPAKIVEKLEKSCARDSSDMAFGEEIVKAISYYTLSIDVNESLFEAVGIGIAVVDSSIKVQTKNGFANADLNKDGKNEFFRSCTGMESIFLTIWSGQPLKSKRVWHRTYYLRYDTEPTCKNKDYEGLE